MNRRPSAALFLAAAGALLTRSLGAQAVPQPCVFTPPPAAAAPAAQPFLPPPLILPLPLPLPIQPVVCPITVRLHFDRYLQSQFNWSAPLTPLFVVGFSQAFTTHTGYPSGRNGFADHYRAEFEGEAASKALRHFIFPALFHQEELYLPIRSGSVGSRMAHAARHLLIAESADHGHAVFNMSGLPASFAAAVVDNRVGPRSQQNWHDLETDAAAITAWRLVSDLMTEFSINFGRLLP